MGTGNDSNAHDAEQSSAVLERLNRLESRVDELEDLVQIYQLLSLYGPSVDSDSRPEASQLWSEEGEYDVDPRGVWATGAAPGAGVTVWQGREQIEAILGGPSHQGRIAQGSAHQVSFPHVSIDGDTAVATCYQTLIMHGESGFRIDRQTANRWELVKTVEGWRVARRTNRLLDGSPEAGELLRRGVAESGANRGSGRDMTGPG